MSQTESITKRLDGKIALVTGGSSGIGLATAQRFVQEGAYVLITGRRQSELDKAVNQIGKNVTDVQADVSNLEDLRRLYDVVKQQKGRIDILFANAGIAESAPLGSNTEDHFDKIFNINVKGLLFTVQRALPLFQDGGSIILTSSVGGSKGTPALSVYNALPLFQDGGSIILTSSVGGSKGTPALSVYNATKAAIRSFARSWTVDLKHRKIRVNAISPGTINTPAVSRLFENGQQAEQVKTALLNIPMGRMGNPDEVAKAVAFLASDDSSYITGIELFVDGGRAQI